jgi:GCM motif protein
VFDEFVEYPVGYIKYAYNGTCTEARAHQSGWAARNANNHNQVIYYANACSVTKMLTLAYNSQFFYVLNVVSLRLLPFYFNSI